MADPLVLSRTDTRTAEITFELPAHEVAVLDGWCQAKRIKRGTALRQILREWSAIKHHESILICRVAGNNPTDPGQAQEQVGEADAR